MKDNNIDDLFRNGLGSHKITPPSATWDKVESQLPTKSKKGVYFWISIAASIILVCAFGWMILSDSQSEQIIDANLEAKKDDTQLKDDSVLNPEPIEAPILNKQLAAQTPVKTPASDIVTPKNSEAQSTAILAETDKSEIPTESNEELFEERLPLELIQLDLKKLPIYYNAKEMSNSSFDMDISIDLESYISSYQILTLEPTKKKRFSLLSGIVNVAKGVNSGKLALSEMRKSKNDFFNNDLKYGSKEGDPEESKGDIDEK